MAKKYYDNAEVFRKICRSDAYVDADTGVVLTPGPQERPNAVEVEPKDPREYWDKVAVIASIGGLILVGGLVALLGFQTIKKLEQADKKQDTYIQENFPREPYRDDVRGR